jgi:RHS repeat-associated protein
MRSEVTNRFVRLQFAGHEYDSGIDRYHMRARQYDPGPGRFLRPDPAFDVDPINPASYNLYAYARSNPNGFVDPTGLEAEPAGEACPVQLCQRGAELPGGALMDKVFGARHWWIKTPNLETGMGKRGAGVPGLEGSETADTLMTTMNDHSGQADAPESQCRAICGVDLAKVEHLARTGRPTGVWIPLVNDCNNVIEDILRQSGTPENMPWSPGHSDWVHEGYLEAERAVRSFGQWLEMQLFFNAAAPWQPFGRL